MLVLDVVIDQVGEHVAFLLLLLNLHQFDPKHLKHEQPLNTKLLNILPVDIFSDS